jgi:hypothetical protein
VKDQLDHDRVLVNDEVDVHLSVQSGVISRRQAVAAGVSSSEIRRLLRRREWAMVHPGVYASHTGQLTWLQRAWAGVLFSWPAALCSESALRACEGPGRRDQLSQEVIHVAVGRRRSTLVEPPGVRLHHVAGLEDRVQWNRSPPRLRYEEAALDLAVEAKTQFAGIAALAQACQSRRTTARRLIVTLDQRAWVRGRDWLQAVLTDVANGTCSVLEHGYLTRVERPHGLPVATRQVKATASTGVIYRDVQYDRVCDVELDGRLFHDSATQRDADLERDLDAAVDGERTTRLSWGQVFDRPCTTAAKVARILEAHGIECRPRPCGPGCAVTSSWPVT